MDVEKWTLESCGITRSPLDAYRGSGRNAINKGKPKPLFSNKSSITLLKPKPNVSFNDITLVKPLTLNTEGGSKEFPETVILKINK